MATESTNVILVIQNFRCKCGNEWVHSDPVLYMHGALGGTPPLDANLTVKRKFTKSWLRMVCTKCIPLDTPEGWSHTVERTSEWMK